MAKRGRGAELNALRQKKKDEKTGSTTKKSQSSVSSNKNGGGRTGGLTRQQVQQKVSRSAGYTSSGKAKQPAQTQKTNPYATTRNIVNRSNNSKAPERASRTSNRINSSNTRGREQAPIDRRQTFATAVEMREARENERLKRNPAPTAKKMLEEREKNKDSKFAETVKNTGGASKKGFLDSVSGHAQSALDAIEAVEGNKHVTEHRARMHGVTDKDTISKMTEGAQGVSKLAREKRLEINEKQEKRQEEWDKKTKDSSGLQKAIYGAAESGTGMATDLAIGRLTGTGQVGALASMASRTYGSTRGQAEKEGATENEDRTYAALQALKEVGTELMFPGVGLAKGFVGKGGIKAGERFANALTKNMRGKAADVAYAGLRMLGGTAEENAEELAGWGLDPFIKDIAYGRNVRARAKESLMSDLPEITSREQAEALTARLNSDSYVNELAAEFKANGLGDKEAKELATKMRDFYAAYYSGDTEKADEIGDDLAGDLTGVKKISKESFNTSELIETIASTTLLTATTGLPGTISTAQRGDQIKQGLKADGLKALAKEVMNSEDAEASERGKIAQAALESGKDITSTQAYDLEQGLYRQQEKDVKRQIALIDTASKQADENGYVAPYTIDEYGRITSMEKATRTAYNEAAESASETLDHVDTKESLTDIDKAYGARAIAGFKTGAFTVDDANTIVADETIKDAFKAETGIDLKQYEVKNRDGSINIPKTNAATKDALFAMATDNLVKMAEAETANWKDVTKGETLRQVTARMGAKGGVAAQLVLNDVDERDTMQYRTMTAVSDYVYQSALNLGVSWEDAKDSITSQFSTIPEEKLRTLYDAGLADRQAANDKMLGLQTKVGEAMSKSAGRIDPTKGNLFIETEETPGSSATEVFRGIAESLGIDIYIVDDLPIKDSDRQANGQYFKGDIYINVNSTFEENLGFIFMHEVTHHLKQYAPEQYKALENLVREEWFKANPEDMMDRIARKIKTYEDAGQALTEEEALEEIIADSTHEFLMDKNFAEQVSKKDPSLAKAVLSAIKNLLRKLRQIFSSGNYASSKTQMDSIFKQLGIMEEAEKLWLDAYTEAAKNKAAVGLVEWQEKAFEEARDSISETDSDYMDAVNRGDMETAQRMVDEAAAEAMPNTKLKGRWYHGTENEFTEFNFSQGGKNGHADGYGIYLTNDPEVASSYGTRMIEGYVNVERPASALDTTTLTNDELHRLIARTVNEEAERLLEEGYDNLGEAKFDTWISNYTDTRYAGDIDKAIDEVIDSITNINGNDYDIVLEIMTGMGIRDYDEASKFYDILTEETGIDGFETKWGDESEMADPSTPTIALAFRSNQIKDASPVTYDDDGNVIPLSERFNAENNDIRYSFTTDQEDLIKNGEIPKSLRDWAKEIGLDEISKQPTKGPVEVSVKSLRSAWFQKDGREDEAEVVNTVLDTIGKSLTNMIGKYNYIDLGDAVNASVHYRTDKDGKPVSVILTCQVKNAEYEVNFDFTTICSKRLAMQRVLERFIKTEGESKGTLYDELKLDEEGMYKLRLILEKAGFEVSCKGCFVEQNRYSQQGQAKTIADDWNKAIDEWEKEHNEKITENFDLVNMDINALDYDEIQEAFNNYSDLMAGRDTNVETKNRTLIEAHPFFRKRMNPSDYASMAGQRALMAIGVKQFRTKDGKSKKGTTLYGLLKRGQSDSKQSVPFTAYNGEISLLPDKMKGRDLADYLMSIGGARAQSASDFQIEFFYDYMQLVADLSARGLPMHMYTKVIELAELFGMTGVKINLSAMCDVDESLGGEYAGLKLVDGEYVYNISDQSIDYDKAVELQKKPGYSKNIGIIMVALSKQHMLKSLDDPDVRYIIGYHSSSMPAVVAQMTNMGNATDYTKLNKTNKLNDKGKALFAKAMEQAKGKTKLAKYKDALRIFDDMIQEEVANSGGKIPRRGNEYARYMSAYGGNTAEFNTYDDLKKSNDARKTADNYIEWCMKNDLVPIYFPFAFHENYYKCEIYDFNMYDNVSGEYAPMEAVQNIYPGLDMTKGETDTTAFMDTVTGMMDERNDINRDLDSMYDNVFDEAKEELKFSISGDEYMDFDEAGIDRTELTPRADAIKTEEQLRDEAYMDAVNSGNMDEAQRLVDEAAQKAGYKALVYHGTGEHFNVFKRGGEGIHLGNLEQASQVAKSRYEIRSRRTRYDWSDVKDRLADLDYASRYAVLERMEEADDVSSYGDYGDLSDIERIREYGERVAAEYYARRGYEPSVTIPTFDRNVSENVMSLYARLDNPFTVNGDILEWTPTNIAEILLKRADGEKKFIHWFTEKTINIDGSELNLNLWDRRSLEKIVNGTVEGDEAWNALDNVLLQNGYSNIRYLNQYEGDKNSYSYIALRPEDVKLSDPVTYDEDGSVIPLSERFDPNNNDIRYSLPTQDSDGNILTDGQMDYFKNSQARDSEGKMQVVYHTTNKGGFTIFDPSYSNDKRSLFFASNWDVSQTYGNYANSRFYKQEINTLDDVKKFLDAYSPDRYFITQEQFEQAGGWEADFVDFENVTKGEQSDFEKYLENPEGYIAIIGVPNYSPDHRSYADDWIMANSPDELVRELHNHFGWQRDNYRMGTQHGYYACYLNLENPYIIDAHGDNWNEIHLDDYDDDVTFNTREIAKMAMDMGFDGVIIRNLVDHGGMSAFDGIDESSDIYIAFSSNQIKDINNENPSENPDIRYSIPPEDETMNYAQTNADTTDNLWYTDPVLHEGAIRYSMSKKDFINGTTDKWNPAWKTEGRVLKEKSVEKDIRNVIMGAMRNSDTSAKYRQKVVKETMLVARKAFDYMKSDEHTKAAALLYDHAHSIIEDLEFFGNQDESEFQRYKELKEYLRTTKITVPEDKRSDIDYEAFRRNNFHKILLGDGGIAPDKVWGHLNELWPEAFSEDIKGDIPGIMLQIENALDIYKPYAEAYSSEQCEEFAGDIANSLWDIIYEGEEYKSLADKYNDKAKAMKLRHQEAMRKVKENYKEKLTKQALEAKRKQYAMLDRQKERYEEKLTKQALDAKRKEYRKLDEQKAKLTDKHEQELSKTKEKYERKLKTQQRKADFEIATLKQNREYNIKRLQAEKKRAVEEERRRSAYKVANNRREQRERQMHRTLYDRILKEYKDLTHRLLNPSKDKTKNIPEQLRQPLAQMLYCFDLEKERSKKLEEMYMIPTRSQLNFRQLKDAMEQVVKEDPTAYEMSDIHKYLKDKMTDLADRVDGKSIDALDEADMQIVKDLLSGLNKAIKDGQQLEIDGENYQKQVQCDKVGEGAAEHQKIYGKAKTYDGARKIVDNILNMGELTPIYFFKGIPGMYDMYRQLRTGFDEYVRNENEIIDKIADILAPYYKTNRKGQRVQGSEIEDWRHAETAETFDLISGDQTITLTIAQRMALYCLAKRSHAQGHMYSENGGIVASEITAGSKITKAKESVKGKIVEQKPVVLTPADVDNIIASLTDDQVKIAEQLQDLMSKDMSVLGNKASMKLTGIEMYKEDNYFPIKVQGDSRPTDIDNIGIREKIRNPGFSNPLIENAQNPIIVDDIFTVVASHCNEMNQYASYAVPITSFMKVYNGSVLDENGKAVKVKTLIRQTYGDKAITYIENFIDDINGNSFKRQGGLDDVLDKALGQAKKAAVFANLRVALQQPTAIVRAFAALDPKYFKGVKPSPKATQEMIEHCPIAQWKAWGYYDTHFGRDIEDVMMGKNVPNKMDYFMSEIYGTLDNMTWGMIWQACKNEVKAKNKGIDENSQEFWDLCNERASYVFDTTQVVDSPFHRSNDMRSKNGLVKQLTSFQAEPTLSFNVLRQGLVDAIDAAKRGNRSKAGKVIIRTLTVWTVQALTVALAQSFVDALRRKGKKDEDDDKDEMLTWYQEIAKYFLRNFGNNLADDMNPINNVYFFKDIVPPILNAIKGEYVFGQQNLTFQWVDTLTNGIEQCRMKWEKGDAYSKSWYDCISEFLGGIGYFAGVPAKTMMRGVKNAWHWFNKVTGANVFADDGSVVDSTVESVVSRFRGSGESSGSESSGTKAGSSEGGTGEPNTTREERDKAIRKEADQIKGSVADKTGEDREKATWKKVTDFIKENEGKSVEELVASGDYDILNKYRVMYVYAGNTKDYFDQRIFDESKSAMKKSILYDPTEQQTMAQQNIKDYLTANGMSEADLSEIAYKSETKKDLAVACRIGDEDAMVESLVPLIRAGLTYEDFVKIYDNRNRVDLKKYKDKGGRYASKLKSMGTFIWPTKGVVTSHFGYRDAPTAGASSNHPAIDIGASQGTPVVAADGGVVIYAGNNGGYGNSVGIKHDNGMVTYYNHLYAWNVKVGDSVGQGQQIAQVGSTGISTGPHLDFKILDKNGKPVDPEKYLN